MFERFTASARDVVRGALDAAEELGHRDVSTEHLLLALAATPSGVASSVLTEARLDADHVRAEIGQRSRPRELDLTEDDAAALRTIGIDLDVVLERIEALAADLRTSRESGRPDDQPDPDPDLDLEPQPRSRGRRPWQRARSRTPGRSRFSPAAKKVLELALREAIHLGDRHIGAEHILLGLLREPRGLAVAIINDAGLAPPDLRHRLLAALDKAA